MMNQLPHERLMVLEDKARLFDKIVRAHRHKVDTLKKPMVDGYGAQSFFTMQVNKVMRDAERYGFFESAQSTGNPQAVKQN